jgi:ABC-type antimicrobial peptide transport system ATPase subunit
MQRQRVIGRCGMISETAPTNIVMPVPNRPDMTIFVEAVPDPSECS